MACARIVTYDALIRAAASSHGIDPALLKATVAVESGFNPRAIREEPQIGDASYGLAQILFRTARSLGYPGPLGDPEALSGLYDPGTNLYLAAKLLAQNLRIAGGNVDVAISAYNAGFSTVRPGDAKRTATGQIVNQAYVDSVRRCYAAYAGDFASPGPPPPAPAPVAAVPEAGPGGGLAVSPAVLALGLAAVLAFLYWIRQRLR